MVFRRVHTKRTLLKGNGPPDKAKFHATNTFAGTCELALGLEAEKKPATSLVEASSEWRWLTNLQAVAVAIAALTFFAFSAGAASVFTPTNVALPGVAFSSVVCGDFNNSGNADVLLTGVNGSFNGISQVWQNHANGSFSNLNAACRGFPAARSRGGL